MIRLFAGRNSLPMIFQNEIAECGLACLAMIVSYHGRHIDLRSLRERLNLPAYGASAKQLLEAGKLLQLDGRPLKLDLADLGRLTLPAVLHWDTDHFVVLRRVTARSILIHDPAAGIRKYSIAEVDLRFTGIAIEFTPVAKFVTGGLSKGFSIGELFTITPGFRRAIYRVFFLSLSLQLLALMSPLYLQLVIDQGLSKGDSDIVLLVALLFSLLVLAKAGVSYFRGVLLLQLSNQLGFQMVSATFSHLLRLPLSFFERREMGDIVSRFSSLDNIKQLVTQELITVIVDGLFSLLTLVLLFLYSPMLATIALGFMVSLILLRMMAVPLEKSYRQEVLQTGAKQQTRFMENVRSIAVTKTYGIEADRRSEWQNYYAYFINSGYRLGHLQLRVGSLHSLISGLDHVATIYLGSVAIFSGHLTIGQLMSFVFLKQNFTGSISAMLPKIAELRLLRLEMDRVSDILLAEAEPEAPCSSLWDMKLLGKVEGIGLGYCYAAGQQPLLQDLDFEVAAGSFLAITGQSGCGKSTLLKLVLGLATPTQGRVLIDGQTLGEAGAKSYKRQIASILHDDGLLLGSLAYNINLGLEPYNIDRMEVACRASCILEDINKLPMRFNTQVGEMGTVFSAGQIQRILLARALYRLPRILVLDEALSHLDIRTARRIVSNIRGQGMTLIMVTHNPGMMEMADSTLCLGEQIKTLSESFHESLPGAT